MDLSASTPVVTGAGRGLGRHLVDALLERGAAKVYALARDTSTVRSDPRVVAVRFDLRDPDSIAAAAQQAADATLLINNASTAAFATPLEADLDAVHEEIAVNFEGVYRTIRAFVPVLEASGGGQIVNVLSLLSLASTAPMTGYSASKAAAHSLTQALRPVLAARGITRPRRLPGRDRHRHARRHRRAQDAARRGRERHPRRARRRPGGHLPRPQRRGDVPDLVERPQGVRTRLRPDGDRVMSTAQHHRRGRANARPRRRGSLGGAPRCSRRAVHDRRARVTPLRRRSPRRRRVRRADAANRRDRSSSSSSRTACTRSTSTRSSCTWT